MAAISAPAARQPATTMRIDEAERGILRQRDALTRRRQRARPAAGSISAAASGAAPGSQSRSRCRSAMSASRVQMRRERRMLACLHQPEMPLRQRQRGIARDGAEHRQADRRDGVAAIRRCRVAGDLVQDHAGDAHSRIVQREAARHGGAGLRLAADVEHQQHRQPEPRGQVGRRAGAARRRSHAVEQAHRTFDHQQLAAAAARAASVSSRPGGIAQLSRFVPGDGRRPRHGTPGRCSRGRTWPSRTAIPRRRRRRSARASRWFCPAPERAAPTISPAVMARPEIGGR